MANYYASCRSNYFKVVDIDKFKEQLPADITVSVEKDGTVCILNEDADGSGWPCEIYNEDTEEHEEYDIENFIASHLQPGSWCVLQEVGAENLRYLVGYAVAFTKDLEHRHSVSLSDIYKLIPPDVTRCEY